MNGARRVIIFCLLTAVLPTILIVIPLYLRHSVFVDVVYEVSETDILEIGGDISTIFCQDHTIKMNTTFNAYQVSKKPDISNTRKHIRLKKSMRLPDDTIEFWGFFLPKGSTVHLSVCSRYDGSNILIVKDDKVLKTCGIMDQQKEKMLNAGNARSNNGSVVYSFDDEVPLEPAVTEKTHQRNKSQEEFNARNSRHINNDENNAAEDESSDGIKTFLFASDIAKRMLENQTEEHEQFRTFEERLLGHRMRHSKKRGVLRDEEGASRTRRSLLMDRSEKRTNASEEQKSSASSFETELLNCYGSNFISKVEFPSSNQCYNVSYLLSNHTSRMTANHTVSEDGYYYYIFYSDNDLVENIMHAVFDISKPTYQFANISEKCVNETICKFPVSFFASEIVIVEVPTEDGIAHEEHNSYRLVSVCHPRMSVYIIFPLLVLILILGCSFL